MISYSVYFLSDDLWPIQAARNTRWSSSVFLSSKLCSAWVSAVGWSSYLWVDVWVVLVFDCYKRRAC